MNIGGKHWSLLLPFVCLQTRIFSKVCPNWPAEIKFPTQEPISIMVDTQVSGEDIACLLDGELHYIILLDKVVGPDLLAPPLISIGCKVKGTRSAVDANDSRQNIKTTDLRNVYMNPTWRSMLCGRGRVRIDKSTQPKHMSIQRCAKRFYH
jgi:hypothetical protein